MSDIYDISDEEFEYCKLLRYCEKINKLEKRTEVKHDY